MTITTDEQLTAYSERFVNDPGYLDFARFGPPSVDVLRIYQQSLKAVAAGHAADVENVLASQERATQRVARHLQVDREQVCFQPATSIGLFQLAYALPATGEVLVWREEFPANVYPWMRAQAHGGPRVRALSGQATVEAVRAGLTAETIAVAVSAVDFRTGCRTDLASIRAAIGDRLLLVDGIQAFGVVEADWALSDALVVGGQKWLRAGWGGGFMRLSSTGLERLGAGLTGWNGVVDANVYDGNVKPSLPTADRFMMTNSSPQAAAALIAALDLVDRVGLSTIAQRIQRSTTQLFSGLSDLGVDLLTPYAPEERAGIVSFRVPGVPALVVGDSLRQLGIIASVRDDHVRLSVHATTTEEVIDRCVHAVRSAGRTS